MEVVKFFRSRMCCVTNFPRLFKGSFYKKIYLKIFLKDHYRNIEQSILSIKGDSEEIIADAENISNKMSIFF